MTTLTLFNSVMFLAMVLASSGSAASALLWGIWGPPLWYITVGLSILLIALVVEVLKSLSGGASGHEGFWFVVSAMGWGSIIWWMLAIPSVVVALLLRRFRRSDFFHDTPDVQA